jgi:hypothetical protein
MVEVVEWLWGYAFSVDLCASSIGLLHSFVSPLSHSALALKQRFEPQYLCRKSLQLAIDNLTIFCHARN